MKAVVILTLMMAVVEAGAVFAQENREQMGPRRFNLEQFDKNGDGKITRDEFPGPPQFFDHLDANGDGVITSDEASRFRREREGRPPFGETLLRALDTDNDGKVSQPEFAGIVSFFTQLDKDKDGLLGPDELTDLALVRPTKTSGGFDIEALFERVDSDKDGMLSESELSSSPQFSNPRFFAMLDQDKDGFVTKDEMRSFMNQQRPK